MRRAGRVRPCPRGIVAGWRPSGKLPPAASKDGPLQPRDFWGWPEFCRRGPITERCIRLARLRPVRLGSPGLDLPSWGQIPGQVSRPSPRPADIRALVPRLPLRSGDADRGNRRSLESRADDEVAGRDALLWPARLPSVSRRPSAKRPRTQARHGVRGRELTPTLSPPARAECSAF